jgi:hypothetical protein
MLGLLSLVAFRTGQALNRNSADWTTALVGATAVAVILIYGIYCHEQLWLSRLVSVSSPLDPSFRTSPPEYPAGFGGRASSGHEANDQRIAAVGFWRRALSRQGCRASTWPRKNNLCQSTLT